MRAWKLHYALLRQAVCGALLQLKQRLIFGPGPARAGSEAQTRLIDVSGRVIAFDYFLFLFGELRGCLRRRVQRHLQTLQAVRWISKLRQGQERLVG